jgi:hypothetical protein
MDDKSNARPENSCKASAVRPNDYAKMRSIFDSNEQGARHGNTYSYLLQKPKG